jgi:hypothetical protein
VSCVKKNYTEGEAELEVYTLNRQSRSGRPTKHVKQTWRFVWCDECKAFHVIRK